MVFLIDFQLLVQLIHSFSIDDMKRLLSLFFLIPYTLAATPTVIVHGMIDNKFFI